jgi:hypothetical protein
VIGFTGASYLQIPVRRDLSFIAHGHKALREIKMRFRARPTLVLSDEAALLACFGDGDCLRRQKADDVRFPEFAAAHCQYVGHTTALTGWMTKCG